MLVIDNVPSHECPDKTLSSELVAKYSALINHSLLVPKVNNHSRNCKNVKEFFVLF